MRSCPMLTGIQALCLRFAWAFIIIWMDTLGDSVLCWQEYRHSGVCLSFYYHMGGYLGSPILSYVDKNTDTESEVCLSRPQCLWMDTLVVRFCPMLTRIQTLCLGFAWAFIIIWVDTLCYPVHCWQEYRHSVWGLLELLLSYGWSCHYWRRCRLQGLLLWWALWTGCIQMLSLFVVVVVLFVPVFLYI